MKLIQRTILSIAASALLLCGLNSCTDESCYEILEAPLRISVHSSVSGLPIDFNQIEIETPLGVSLVANITVKGIGAPKDSAIYRNAPNLKRLDLPLRDIAEETLFELTYTCANSFELADTIVIQHKNLPNFLSVYCGSIFFHDLESFSVTNNRIESMEYIKQKVTNEEEIHLMLLYNPTVKQ